MLFAIGKYFYEDEIKMLVAILILGFLILKGGWLWTIIKLILKILK